MKIKKDSHEDADIVRYIEEWPANFVKRKHTFVMKLLIKWIQNVKIPTTSISKQMLIPARAQPCVA